MIHVLHIFCIKVVFLYFLYFLEFLFPFHRQSASARQASWPFVLFCRINLMNIQTRPRMRMRTKKIQIYHLYSVAICLDFLILMFTCLLQEGCSFYIHSVANGSTLRSGESLRRGQEKKRKKRGFQWRKINFSIALVQHYLLNAGKSLDAGQRKSRMLNADEPIFF